MSPDPAAPELLAYLESFLTEARREKIETVLAQRSDFLRVVVEDLFQPHNASAVMRSCEGFGVQHMHVIENRHAFAPNREIALGSAQWITLHRHRDPATDNTGACLTELKAQGYRIVATALRADAVPLEEIPIDRPLALVFGTEKEGVSERVLELADATTIIPMFGFTQSFNISVSAAICLAELMRRIRAQRPDWHLRETEKAVLRERWIRQSLKAPESLERRFREDRSTPPG